MLDAIAFLSKTFNINPKTCEREFQPTTTQELESSDLEEGSICADKTQKKRPHTS